MLRFWLSALEASWATLITSSIENTVPAPVSASGCINGKASVDVEHIL